jgi:aspartate oxidase
MATFRYDVLIIGSGAAGLTVALGLPDGVQAALLSKGELTHASTYYATATGASSTPPTPPGWRSPAR